MINVNEFKNLSFLFVFDNDAQMKDFFSDACIAECFPQRTAAYNLCANNLANEDMKIVEQKGNTYIVEDNSCFYKNIFFTIDISGKISSENSFATHRQLADSKLVLDFPKALENLAKKYPDSTFYGMIHDTDFDWWETTITYEYKNGTLEINRDGYSEDGDSPSRTANIVIPIR